MDKIYTPYFTESKVVGVSQGMHVVPMVVAVNHLMFSNDNFERRKYVHQYVTSQGVELLPLKIKLFLRSQID